MGVQPYFRTFKNKIKSFGHGLINGHGHGWGWTRDYRKLEMHNL